MQRLALFLATDVLFAVTSYAFLLVGEAFGKERLETRPAEVYPGEFSNVNTKCRQIGLLSSASKEQDLHACCRAVEGTFRQKNNAKVLQDIPSGERMIAVYLRRSIALARGEAVRAEGQPKCTIWLIGAMECCAGAASICGTASSHSYTCSVYSLDSTWIPGSHMPLDIPYNTAISDLDGDGLRQARSVQYLNCSCLNF